MAGHDLSDDERRVLLAIGEAEAGGTDMNEAAWAALLRVASL